MKSWCQTVGSKCAAGYCSFVLFGTDHDQTKILCQTTIKPAEGDNVDYCLLLTKQVLGFAAVSRSHRTSKFQPDDQITLKYKILFTAFLEREVAKYKRNLIFFAKLCNR